MTAAGGPRAAPHGTMDLARAAADLWGVDAASLEHVGDSGNSVWTCRLHGACAYLRLTDPGYRSPGDTEAEVDFIEHLSVEGARVSRALPSRSGRRVERVGTGDATALACLFEAAPGALVARGDPLWGEELLRAWGRALGRIHRAARTFAPSGPARWHWIDEPLLAQASALLPPRDDAVRAELERLCGQPATWGRAPEVYGMTHADFGPQNFRYSAELGITAFDFGNACYHWFASDIAISLSTLRRWPKDERDAYRAWMLEAYRQECPLAVDQEGQLDTLLQLRILYVYLDRLERFGRSEAPEHRALLDELRVRVLERFTW